ncbi:hypothetical protein MCEJIRE27_00489 [Candidatus Nanopelagicaceae bacterium]
MAKDNLWDDGYEPDAKQFDYSQPPICGGVRFESDETKKSIDWGMAVSSFFTIGMISIVGHLINMWLN